MPFVLVNSALLVSQAILTEAGFSFLGLGDPRAVSYGLMLRNAQPYLHLGEWWLFVFPGVALFVTVLGLNVAADGMIDALDPRQMLARAQ
jgi:peptide/nickel transport system permease protein